MLRIKLLTSMLLLANLVIFSHAVIPHHHHIDHICFHADACSGHGEATRQIPEDTSCCQLSDILVMHPGNSRTEINCPCCKHTSYSPAFHAIIQLPATLMADSGQLPFRQIPMSESLPPGYLFVTPQLRAPPRG